MQDQEINDLDQLAEEMIDEAMKQENIEVSQEAKEEAAEDAIFQKKLDEALGEQKNQYLRLSADFANYKKRVEKERLDHLKYANEKLIIELLSVLDNLERAIAHSDDTSSEESLASGVKMVYKSLDDILKKQGLAAIEVLEKPFDHFLHHAVMTEHSDDYEEDTVIQEFQKGYMLNAKVIRPSMVKVASKE